LFMSAVLLLIGCLDRTPNTYHSAGVRSGTATSTSTTTGTTSGCDRFGSRPLRAGSGVELDARFPSSGFSSLTAGTETIGTIPPVVLATWVRQSVSSGVSPGPCEVLTRFPQQCGWEARGCRIRPTGPELAVAADLIVLRHWRLRRRGARRVEAPCGRLDNSERWLWSSQSHAGAPVSQRMPALTAVGARNQDVGERVLRLLVAYDHGADPCEGIICVRVRGVE